MKLKSQRPKKRYIVFEAADKMDNFDGNELIKKAVFDAMGNKHEAGIRFLKDKYKPSIQRGILRVNNKYAKLVIDAINKSRCIKTVGMSGILRKAEEKYLRVD